MIIRMAIPLLIVISHHDPMGVVLIIINTIIIVIPINEVVVGGDEMEVSAIAIVGTSTVLTTSTKQIRTDRHLQEMKGTHYTKGRVIE